MSRRIWLRPPGIALIAFGIVVLVGGYLYASGTALRQATDTVVSAEMQDQNGMPDDAEPGDCLNSEHKIVACTDENAIRKITHVSTYINMAAYNARMEQSDICAEGETTTAYSGTKTNGRTTVYCLAWTDTATAEQLAKDESEAAAISSSGNDFYRTAQVNDCAGGDATGYQVVPCADATAAWKVTKRTVATRAELDSPDNALCAQNESTVSQWTSEDPDEQADVLCLSRTR
ncbi:hypothetical protein SAMN05421874_13832 [Nonomuraea maritima]|uniref:Uncharacterized protein n=1 Tax=Nonomuraea maritima TaxID=683260 RepID=A0A1G9QCS2_9ACTN|nr:hypothetical protein [Nonomuraea maritima]SDM08862.1 hypothetical protein SAMN05421874_13832 [Nonomuraea maritima]